MVKKLLVTNGKFIRYKHRSAEIHGKSYNVLKYFRECTHNTNRGTYPTNFSFVPNSLGIWSHTDQVAAVPEVFSNSFASFIITI